MNTLNIRNNKLNIKKNDMIILLIIMIISVIVNTIYSYNNLNRAGELGIIIGIADTFLYGTYLLLVDTPVLAMCSLTIYELINLLYTALVGGESLMNNIYDSLFLILVTITSILVNCCILKKKTKEDAKNKLKISDYLNYNRKVYKVKWYYNIIIYSTIVIFIMNLSNSEFLATYLSGTVFRVYAALAIAIPYITFLGLISTTTLAYELFGIAILARILTLFIMKENGGYGIALEAVYIILQVVILIISELKIYKMRDNIKSNSKAN